MNRGRQFSPQNNSEMPFFLCIRRKENASELKHGDTLRAGQDVALQNSEKRREEISSQRGVIFVQRIPQFDRAFTRARSPRNQLRSARLAESAAGQTRPHTCLEIVIPISF